MADEKELERLKLEIETLKKTLHEQDHHIAHQEKALLAYQSSQLEYPICELSGKSYQVLSGVYDSETERMLNKEELSKNPKLLLYLQTIGSPILQEITSEKL